MDFSSKLIAIVAISIFILFAFVNLYFFINRIFSKDGRSGSFAPLVGGVLGCFGFLLIPELRYYAWLPLLLDLGTAEVLIFLPFLIFLIYEEWKICPLNLISEYKAVSEDREVIIRFYKSQIYALECTVKKDFGKYGFGGISYTGNWTENNGIINPEPDNSPIEFEKLFSEGKDKIRLISSPHKYLSDLDFYKTR